MDSQGRLRIHKCRNKKANLALPKDDVALRQQVRTSEKATVSGETGKWR